MGNNVGEIPSRADTAVRGAADWRRSVRVTAFGGLGVAVTTMVVLHVLGAGRLDPARTTVSDYVSLPGGTALLSIAILGVAVATASVLIGLINAGAARHAWWYGLGCAGLVATITFPTNVLGTAESPAAVLHRYAAGLFLVSLPVAAFLTLRLLPDRAVALLTILSAVAGLAFLLSHVPLLFPNWPSASTIHAVLPRGVAERVLLATDIALLGALTRRVTR